MTTDFKKNDLLRTLVSTSIHRKGSLVRVVEVYPRTALFGANRYRIDFDTTEEHHADDCAVFDENELVFAKSV
jgi:predicted nuclease with RNAse H fold